ncbi:unnamed protein product [Cladocopium goreaui]|uniref:Uncharacterized protein n=1 Tax=Cladocopium goreaui TaxID=2562237 RepID=A0A9P1BPE7_9DINO|nr:unnamed protein product [Cladocopium goreaui]
MRRKQKNMGSKGRWVSASHWLHHRRQAVQSAVSGEKIGERVSSRKVAISRMAKRMWGEKHENEKRFNLKKETERRIGAFRQGLIFKGKKRLARQAVAADEAEKKKRKLYFKSLQLRDEAVEGPRGALPTFENMVVLNPVGDKLRDVVKKRGSKLVTSMSKVTAVLQKDALKPNMTASFFAFLKGVYVASHKYFQTKGKRGLLIPYKLSKELLVGSPTPSSWRISKR